MARKSLEVGELWAATIERFEFAPRSKTYEMRLSVLDGGRARTRSGSGDC